MNECFICNKHNGKNDATKYYVLSTPYVSIYHMYPTDKKVYLGYVFIETNRHISSLDEMTLEEAYEVGKYLKIISKTFKEFFGAEHVYSFVFGDGVPHLHVHLVPRYKGAPEAFRGMRVTEWSDAPHGNEEETVKYCSKLAEKINYLCTDL